MSILTFLNGRPSEQQSQSTSSSNGVDASQSLSDSISNSQSTTGGQSSSQQNVAFGDLFQQLFANAGGAAGKIAGMVPGLADQVGQLFNGGMDTLKNLGGGAGADYINNRLNGPGTVDASIDALGNDLGDFFNMQLNPSLRLGAAANGTLGGDRSEVARGTAAGQVAKAFSSGAASLRAGDQSQRDTLASTLLNNGTQNAGLSLSALPELAGLAQGGATAGMLPYSLLSQIMGGPTVLGSSQSSQFGESSSDALAHAISSSFGQQSSTSQSTGQATGTTGGVLDMWQKFMGGFGSVMGGAKG
jgi:hypothetical protein